MISEPRKMQQKKHLNLIEGFELKYRLQELHRQFIVTIIFLWLLHSKMKSRTIKEKFQFKNVSKITEKLMLMMRFQSKG